LLSISFDFFFPWAKFFKFPLFTGLSRQAEDYMGVALSRAATPLFVSAATLAIAPLAAHAANIPVFGTGLNDSGSLLTTETKDPHYTLVLNPQGGNGPYVTDTSNYPFINPSHPNTIWVANTSTSQWISPQPTYVAGGAADASGDYDYRTTFSMAGLDPTSAVISGKFAVDAAVTDVLINGISTGINGDPQTSFTNFTISSGFLFGNNTLDFLVHNNVLANGNTTGIQVQMTGTANALVPEPASLSLVLPAALLLLRRKR
jgi:hypothetical protein